MSAIEENKAIITQTAPHAWEATVYVNRHDTWVTATTLSARTRDGVYRKVTRYLRKHTNPFTQAMQIETRTIKD